MSRVSSFISRREYLIHAQEESQTWLLICRKPAREIAR